MSALHGLRAEPLELGRGHTGIDGDHQIGIYLSAEATLFGRQVKFAATRALPPGLRVAVSG